MSVGKDLHRPCARYGITQGVIRLVVQTLAWHIRCSIACNKLGVGLFVKLIDRYNEGVDRVSYNSIIHEALRIDKIC